MTRQIAQNLLNSEDAYLNEEQSFEKELSIVYNWIKLEALRKQSATHISGLSDRVIEKLRKGKFTVVNNSDDTYWVSWDDKYCSV